MFHFYSIGEPVPDPKGSGELSGRGQQGPLLRFLLMLSRGRPSQATRLDEPTESSHWAATSCLKITLSALSSVRSSLLIEEL